jgi:hypothetical protein
MIFASVGFLTVFEKHFVLQINFIAQYLCRFRRIDITANFNESMTIRSGTIHSATIHSIKFIVATIHSRDSS